MKRGKRQALEEPQINLTPLIDVVFVVLIMFIVIAPLLESERVELAQGRPSSTEKQLEKNSEISIYVHGDNSIYLHQKKLRLEELKQELALEKKRFPQARPQLFHDKKATFGTYQSIKNAVEAAGFSEMDVILKPDN